MVSLLTPVLVLKDFGAHLISMFGSVAVLCMNLHFPLYVFLFLSIKKTKCLIYFILCFYIVLQGSEKLLQLVSDSSFSLSQIALQLSTLLWGMRMKPSMMALNMVSIIQLVLHG